MRAVAPHDVEPAFTSVFDRVQDAPSIGGRVRTELTLGRSEPLVPAPVDPYDVDRRRAFFHPVARRTCVQHPAAVREPTPAILRSPVVGHVPHLPGRNV